MKYKEKKIPIEDKLLEAMGGLSLDNLKVLFKQLPSDAKISRMDRDYSRNITNIYFVASENGDEPEFGYYLREDKFIDFDKEEETPDMFDIYDDTITWGASHRAKMNSTCECKYEGWKTHTLSCKAGLAGKKVN